MDCTFIRSQGFAKNWFKVAEEGLGPWMSLHPDTGLCGSIVSLSQKE
jgi:hypothetical protein